MTRDLAAFAVETRYEDIPAQAMYEAKYLLMDTIGCALAALTTDKGKMTVALCKRYGGPPESSIIGVSGKVSCGTTLIEESKAPRGAAHGTPLIDDELIDKFRLNAQRVLTQDNIEKAVEAFTHLEKVDDVNEVMSHISIL